MVHDWERYPNFNEHETECKCGCGINNMNEDVVACLQEISDYIFEHTGHRQAINIERGCSCFEHNMDIGGSPTSSHIADLDKECYAVDLKVANSTERYWILRAAFGLFRRIGLYNSHNGVHLDLDPKKMKDVVWKV